MFNVSPYAAWILRHHTYFSCSYSLTSALWMSYSVIACSSRAQCVFLPLKAPVSFSSICCICSHWRLKRIKERKHEKHQWSHLIRQQTGRIIIMSFLIKDDIIGLLKKKKQTWKPLEGKLSAWLFLNEAQCVSTACVCRSLSLIAE